MADSPPPPRAPGAYLRLALWQRFALAGLVTVALLVALVVFVQNNNTDTPRSSNPAADLQANREAEILVAQDQAPHTAPLPAGPRPAQAAARVVRASVERRIARGELSGPLRQTGCRVGGGGRRARRAFSCTAVAGSVSYLFVGVIEESARLITYCKRDPPPAPSDNVPVSPRCRA
ncbi:MAG TPA: hypothetical protein VGH45_11340 [Solirubrobacteraceae bacterium]